MPILANEDGEILDGHHRYRVCVELGIPVRWALRKFPDKLFEKKFVIECNLHRRQLNEFQKAELGIPLQKINAEIARDKMTQGGKNKTPSHRKPFHSGQETAARLSMSPTTFKRAKKIIEVAPASVKEELRDGKTTITKEYQKIQKDEKRKKRHAQIQKIQVKLPSNVTLYNQEFQSAPIPKDKVSLIFTDPPYHERWLPLYEELAIHAAQVLRYGGSLLCYAGHYAIGRIITMMEKHGLHFQWPMAVIHGGPSASVFGRKVLIGYKPLLWFTKGKYEGEFVRDVIQSKFEGKELHEWAQSTVESDYYIRHMTIKDDIVYDPFLGSGTFGVSAVRQKRQFIGCEIEKDHYENARRLITNAST